MACRVGVPLWGRFAFAVLGPSELPCSQPVFLWIFGLASPHLCVDAFHVDMGF